jgi:hypothetical protein
MKFTQSTWNTLMVATLACGLFVTGCKKKEGCTDPTSLNYDAEAEKDNGTCTYSTESVIVDNGSGTGTTTWTSNKTYILDGFVFVNAGQTLTIEAGTVIKGRAGQGTESSALVVACGGKIIAQGTAAKPIIFTAEQDDVTNANDIPAGTSGLWGGLIILGKATLNSTPGVSSIEGIPTTETRGLYGGTNDADNSGVLKYVSVRYGGTDIGAGNEINGVTFGGVGTGTTVEYVEVYSNADDAFEFFGGTVNSKYLVAALPGDDCFDYDEGFRGKGQFWFSLNSATAGDRGGEHDGGTNPENGTPYATPRIYNATYIGISTTAGKRAITFRDNAGGEYHNSIFQDWGKGVDIELLSGGSTCSYSRFQASELKLNGNVFWNIGTITDPTKLFTISGDFNLDPTDSTAALTAVRAHVADGGNSLENPMLIGITREATGNLNPNPSNAAVLTGGVPAGDAWFTPATYKGAFDGSNNWLRSWTALDALGYL